MATRSQVDKDEPDEVPVSMYAALIRHSYDNEEAEMTTTKDKFDKMVKTILNLGPVKHERPPNPSKKDLERKFRLVMKDGRPVMGDVTN